MMNLNDAKNTEISYLLFKIIKKFSEIDKKTRYYGTNRPLFYSEIHMIKAIKENEGIHITGLAEILGVSKAAVSQIIIRLEKKGLIIKEKDVTNQTKFLSKLTPLGEIAYINHFKFHESFDQMLAGILDGESGEKIDFLKRFLTTLKNELDIFSDKVGG
ncbi:MarR family winged helix-turn-helix transcriptional regulator [Pectinatus frisingensis]|uniref:MarR family winged helix-turn-helix transcriptional regulator n=1 Tax=Pectinatus frisingensis TaxID=865 RepID=UPI003D806373